MWIASICVLSPISEAGARVMAADGWSYGLPDSCGRSARSVSAHSRANSGLLLRPGSSTRPGGNDPLRLRTNLNKMNIRRDESWRKPQKTKNCYMTLSALKSLFSRAIHGDAN